MTTIINEKKFAMVDGDTRYDTNEKTQNDSDTESDEWKYDLNNVDVCYGREGKVYKMRDVRPGRGTAHP